MSKEKIGFKDQTLNLDPIKEYGGKSADALVDEAIDNVLKANRSTAQSTSSARQDMKEHDMLSAIGALRDKYGDLVSRSHSINIDEDTGIIRLRIAPKKEELDPTKIYILGDGATQSRGWTIRIRRIETAPRAGFSKQNLEDLQRAIEQGRFDPSTEYLSVYLAVGNISDHGTREDTFIRLVDLWWGDRLLNEQQKQLKSMIEHDISEAIDGRKEVDSPMNVMLPVLDKEFTELLAKASTVNIDSTKKLVSITTGGIVSVNPTGLYQVNVSDTTMVGGWHVRVTDTQPVEVLTKEVLRDIKRAIETGKLDETNRHLDVLQIPVIPSWPGVNESFIPMMSIWWDENIKGGSYDDIGNFIKSKIKEDEESAIKPSSFESPVSEPIPDEAVFNRAIPHSELLGDLSKIAEIIKEHDHGTVTIDVHRQFYLIMLLRKYRNM